VSVNCINVIFFFLSSVEHKDCSFHTTTINGVGQLFKITLKFLSFIKIVHLTLSLLKPY